MFDAMKLLGSVLQGQTGQGTPTRFDALAASAPPPQAQAQGGMGNMAAGGLGALAGALLGRSGPGMLGGGMLAVVGNIAVQALQAHLAGNANQGSTFQGAPQGAPMQAGNYNPQGPDAQRKATLIIRAMIQSAKADGNIDPVEMQRIMGKVDEHGHDPAARAFVNAEITKPIDLPGLARDVTSPQEAVEVYAASIMVLNVDSQPERDYLADLAQQLNIAPAVVAQVHQTFGVA